MDKPARKDLIAALKQSLEQTKGDLHKKFELRAELKRESNPSAKELERIDADITTLKNMVEQTEEAISGLTLTKRERVGGFDGRELALGE